MKTRKTLSFLCTIMAMVMLFTSTAHASEVAVASQPAPESVCDVAATAADPDYLVDDVGTLLPGMSHSGILKIPNIFGNTITCVVGCSSPSKTGTAVFSIVASRFEIDCNGKAQILFKEKWGYGSHTYTIENNTNETIAYAVRIYR